MANFRDILRYFKDYRAIAIYSIAITSLFEVIDLVVPYIVGQVINILSGQPIDAILNGMVQALATLLQTTPGQEFTLGSLLVMVFLVTVVRSPIQPWVGLWFHWDIPLRARRDQTQRTIQKILTLPLEFYDEHNPGRIAGRLARGLSNHTWGYPEVAGQFIPKLVRVMAIIVFIALLNWPIALLILASFVGMLSYLYLKLRQLIRREEALDRYMESTESRTSEIITNIKTVKAFATEQDELQRQTQRLNRELKVVIHRIHKGYVVLYTQQRLVVQASTFAVFVLTLWATLNGRMSIGHFITTYTVASMAYAELEPLSMLAEVFARRYASLMRFHEFMKLPSGSDAASLEHGAGIRQYQFTGKVDLSHVTFGYERDRPVLNDINLLIEPYQTVALVGRSGSGKSTLVKLLFRYFEPQSGRILMDGQDIRQLDVSGYRKRLAIVHQEVDVFNGTLLDNLTYGNGKASFPQVEEACRIARVDEFIHLLPDGYFTIVGERGVRLSGGQRQRLGIARALLMDPDVLVFDEATSSLDYESERSIQLAMRSILGTRTTLIIAHRLSTVREADKIVVLDQGQIVEVGNHEELLQRGGLYHRLHTLQETGELLA
ncbi:ABC transporter ATP-binding protein [Leptolyngbya sp. CCY15150]|uniref:ABC transporter ATP-binding protein n=1 Tax=Leptolyngbya sp. CCY15150 TaxID=2767772 RepID=UPI0019526064|nr:ABC transporter ATP-binding protein [Leptolyngbya sp. CCY15150]